MSEMGNRLSFLMKNLFKKKKSNILMCGLDGVGKTTILYDLKLKNRQVPETVPTIGFNVETIAFNKVMFTIRDVGGQERMRASWANFYGNVNAVIFVVDSADTDRMQETTEEFQKLIHDDRLSEDAVLLVLANKQDLDNALSVQEMIEVLGLSSLKIRNWFVQPTCALTGKGLYEGLQWLSKNI